MKRIINLLFVASIVFTSCTTIEFKEVVPKKTCELSKFPKKMRGEFVDKKDNDTLRINQDNFKYGNDNTAFHLVGKLKEENTVLKKFGEYYILNVKSKSNNNWEVIPFKYVDDKINVYYLILDLETENKEKAAEYEKERIKNLGLLTDLKVVSDTSSNNNRYEINPSDSELKKILEEDFFVKIIELERIK